MNDPIQPARDPIQQAISRAGASIRAEACRATAKVSVGLILNPRARRLRSARARRQLLRQLPADAVRQTRDLASLRRALASLVGGSGVNVLAIAGGDGTVHHTINALLELTEETAALSGITPP